MAEGLDRALDHPRHVVVARDIRLDGDGVAARHLDRAHGGDVVAGAESGAGDRGTFLGEVQRRGTADARSRAGHDRRLAAQPHVGLMRQSLFPSPPQDSPAPGGSRGLTPVLASR